MFESQKRAHMVEFVFYIFLLFAAIMWIGLYMIGKWERMRDVKRQTDARQIRTVVEMYLTSFDSLPDNETNYDWDYSYNPETDKVSILFRGLIEKDFITPVFDPMNSEKYYYRYHKFKAGEYGCERNFAIFQIMSFEGKIRDRGQGICPERNFAAESPNGYTIQWFE